MSVERARNRREVLFAGAAMGVAWVLGGCTDDEEDVPIWHSIRHADALLEKGFQYMYEHLSQEDRAIIDNEILKRKDVLIHIIRGKLDPEKSRGGASTLASQARDKGLCSEHPKVEDLPKRREWDLRYDAPLAEGWEKENEIYNRIDVILYHEIFGHVLPILKDPGLYDVVAKDKQSFNDFEDKARIIENRYRSYRGLRLVPAELPRRVKP